MYNLQPSDSQLLQVVNHILLIIYVGTLEKKLTPIIFTFYY